VARAAPDGYTLHARLDRTSAVNPALYAKLPFDLVRDLDMVSLVARQQRTRAAPERARAEREELVALAKAQPASSLTPRRATALRCTCGRALQADTGVDLVHVPYKARLRR